MIILTGNDLTLAQVIRCAEGGEKVVISKGATERVKSSRKKIEDYISSGAPIYGVNTGFGDLISERIGPDKIKELQRNLIRSHSSGYENVFAVLKRKGYFVIGDFFPNDKADPKFLTSFSELIEDVNGEGQGKWKYGIKILRKR